MNEVTWYLCFSKKYSNHTLINFKYGDEHYFTSLIQDNIETSSRDTVFNCCLQQTYEEFIKDNIHYPVLKRHAIKLTSNLYKELTK